MPHSVLELQWIQRCVELDDMMYFFCLLSIFADPNLLCALRTLIIHARLLQNSVINQNADTKQLCEKMASPKGLEKAQKLRLADARQAFTDIVLSSSNLIFVTSAANRMKANYNKGPGKPNHIPEPCKIDKTTNVKACGRYIEGVKDQARDVATQMAKLFQSTVQEFYAKEVTLSWASDIQSGCQAAMEM